ncbi:MAG: alpha/beta hydrolase domain-containing protein, partial [Actinomycetota bacterium]|nr:alpha/beta hydrolase domain-containing protein [Actinomycetota bacterium]
MSGVDVVEEHPYAKGRSFGETGPAVLRRLVVHHQVDPADPANSTISDLGVSVRNEAGLVEFDHDVVVVEPADPTRRNGWVLVDVVNRGRPTVPGFVNMDETPRFPPPLEPPPGDGLLFSEGWTIAHVGWQFDVSHPALMGLRAPGLALDPSPVGEVSYTMSPVRGVDEMPLSLPGHAAFVCCDPESADLTLTWADGVAEAVDRADWEFAREGQRVRLRGGFVPGASYTCSYPAADPVVAGCGLLALRDVAPWLKAESGAENALLFGVSQCGRVVRQFLYDGMNAGTDGGQVYAGVMPLIAGGRRGEFNARFGNPGSLPYGKDGLGDDPSYGALLRVSDERGVAPKVMAVNTS